jgi:hypothetical protein
MSLWNGIVLLILGIVFYVIGQARLIPEIPTINRILVIVGIVMAVIGMIVIILALIGYVLLTGGSLLI